MSKLRVEKISKFYQGEDRGALLAFSISVDDGELLVMVGESGSGKSTFLRLVAGFEYPDEGKIFINENLVAGNGTMLAPEKRNVGLVFQDFALFPHMTVYKNIAFGLKGNSGQNRVKEMLELVNLKGFETKYPHQLSGGEQQRVALARSLAPNPDILLLDEPFSNLDEVNKFRMREELRLILKKTSTTAILVTHDTKDALAIADRIAIINQGKMDALGTPASVYDQPGTEYASLLFGRVNIITSQVRESRIITPFGEIETTLPDQPVKIMIRPEGLSFCLKSEGVPATVEQLIFGGDHCLVRVLLQNPDYSQILYIKIPANQPCDVGEQVYVKAGLSMAKVVK